MGTKDGADTENLLSAIHGAGASHRELDELRRENARLSAKLAETENLRDEALGTLIDERHEWRSQLDAVTAERDTAIAELARLRAENGWRPMAELPQDLRDTSGDGGPRILLHHILSGDVVVAFWANSVMFGGLGWHTIDSKHPFQEKDFSHFYVVPRELPAIAQIDAALKGE
jgi:hypothetical protein